MANLNRDVAEYFNSNDIKNWKDIRTKGNSLVWNVLGNKIPLNENDFIIIHHFIVIQNGDLRLTCHTHTHNHIYHYFFKSL